MHSVRNWFGYPDSKLNECESVGMMGSGKTTVGKILSQAIHYSFCDRLVHMIAYHLGF
jgi:ABC-type polysaccharide/polyol phosphate transport system ATPase subunit